MSTRISTSMLYQQSISTLQSKQAAMAKVQEQLATGKKLVTAKDDPVGAGVAIGLDRAFAELERFGANGSTVRHRLGMQESVLTQAGQIMSRITELTVQANGGGMSAEDRQAIAIEVQSLRDNLLDLANSSDGTGRYLFGGTQDDSPPFTQTAGGVTYSGNQNQRRVEVAPELFVADALPGSEIFMRIRTGDGRVDASSSESNSGTAYISDFGVIDSAAWTAGRYRIEFGADAAYSVKDQDGNEVAAGTYAPGEAITFAGARIVLQGMPADGDNFEFGPSSARDIFATVDRLIDTLRMTPASPAERAAQQSALQSAMRDISMAQEHFIDVRASGGAQLSALDNADSLRDAQGLTIETTLSGVRDLDYAEAISRFNLHKVALDAAQLSFMQMQRLSLFDLLR